MSLLGVPHLNKLEECTGVLPLATPEFENPDQEELTAWLNSDAGPNSPEAILLMNGDSLKRNGTKCKH